MYLHMEIIRILVLLLSAWKWDKKTEKWIWVEIKIKESEIGRISLVSVLRFTGKDTLILLTHLLSLLLAHYFQETFFFFPLAVLQIFLLRVINLYLLWGPWRTDIRPYLSKQPTVAQWLQKPKLTLWKTEVPLPCFLLPSLDNANQG